MNIKTYMYVAFHQNIFLSAQALEYVRRGKKNLDENWCEGKV